MREQFFLAGLCFGGSPCDGLPSLGCKQSFSHQEVAFILTFFSNFLASFPQALSFELLPLKFLHNLIVVLHFCLVLFDPLFEDIHFLPDLFILLEQFESLGFEVVELVAQLPECVLGVFLLDDPVKFLDHLPGLFSHLVYLISDQREHFVLLVLQFLHQVVVDGVDEVVDLAVVEFDGLLGFLQGLLVLEGGGLVEEGEEGGADASQCLVDAGHVPLLQEGVVGGEQAGPQVFHVVIIKLIIMSGQ